MGEDDRRYAVDCGTTKTTMTLGLMDWVRYSWIEDVADLHRVWRDIWAGV